MLKNISVWNILLMVFSLLIAIYLPFEIFLFAYAVLGPIHYLTEINWLNEKSFFLSNKKYAWILVGLTTLTFIPMIAAMILPLAGLEEWQKPLTTFGNRCYGSIVLFCLVVAAGLVYSGRWLSSLLLGALVAVLLYFTTSYAFLVALFLPSLVHVYLFTLLFILYGALKSKDNIALLEGVALLMVPFIIYLLPLDAGSYAAGSKTLVRI